MHSFIIAIENAKFCELHYFGFYLTLLLDKCCQTEKEFLRNLNQGMSISFSKLFVMMTVFSCHHYQIFVDYFK